MKRIGIIIICLITLTITVFSETNDEVLYKQAMEFFRLKKFSYALDNLNELINNYPDSELQHKAVYFKGVSMFYLFNKDKSITLVDIESVFDQYIDQYADSEYFASALKWKGDIYYFNSEFETAAEKYADIISNYPQFKNRDIVMYRRAKANEKLQRYILARTILERILEQYPDTGIKKQVDFDIKRLNKIINK